jgi:hypothetical protein
MITLISTITIFKVSCHHNLVIDDDEAKAPEKKEKKKLKVNKDNELNNIIDVKPQNAVLSTKTEASRGINDRKFLLQNYIGSVKATIFA